MIFGHHFDFKDGTAGPFEGRGSFGIPPRASGEKIVCVVRKGSLPFLEKYRYVSDWVSMAGRKARYLSAMPFEHSGGSLDWALEIEDVLTLAWRSASREITYNVGSGFSPRRLRFWIYHTFFPLALEVERACHILHVGSVEIHGKPVLFSAFSLGGKSTLTDYFVRRGHPMFSDDSLGIERKGSDYMAVPSYPFCRPFREPEALGYPVGNFAVEPKPVRAAYLLDKGGPDTGIHIAEVRGIEKFKAFHYSVFCDFDFMKRERFEFFTGMARKIPVYRVTFPHDLKALPDVYAALVRHCEHLLLL